MAKTPPSGAALRVSNLAQNARTRFDITPDAAALAAMAEVLEVRGLRKVRFAGDVRAHGKVDWLLTGALGATVIQPCAVTLEPVTTRIDVPVRRVYARNFVEDTDAPEVEMPQDDEIEHLGAWIDPEAVLMEALSLAVPDYPRAPGVALGETVVTEPGKAPLTHEAARPFAGLADLKAKLDKDPSE